MSTKIIFFGTSEFAVSALEALTKEGYEIIAVVTTPDEPAGRKQIPTPPPIKLKAKSENLKILQPESLKNNPSLVACLLSLHADVGVVAAYGKIIPAEIINLPRYGILNIHPSPLPKYRGPTPIQSAILNGEEDTGVTIIKIDEEVDHGPIIAQSEKIKMQNKRYEELHDDLAKIGAGLLIKILPDYIAGKIKPVEQDHSQATFTKIIKKEDGKIDWNKTAEEIYNQFLAFHLWPGIWTRWNPPTGSGQAKTLKIAGCIPLRSCWNETCECKAGVVCKEGEHVFVSCNTGYLEILRLQLEGGKEMDIKSFLAGHKNFIDSKLE